MNNPLIKLNWWERRNWWKIASFTMLAIFELTREIAVLAGDPQPKVAVSAYVGSTAGYVTATGRWTRIDGGESMVPSATNISCREDDGQCVEATAHMFDGYLSEPIVDTFEAKFMPDAVSYENDNAECARYSVRIDLDLQKVFAIRERKANPTNAMCKKLEPRIEMALRDGYQRNDNPLGDHFVPLIRTIGWILD